MNFGLRDLAYMVVAASLGIGVYFMFRAMYLVEEPLPFAQEMTLVFLGAVVTIALTAALLNRQTELELRKEGRVLILQQQCEASRVFRRRFHLSHATISRFSLAA